MADTLRGLLARVAPMRPDLNEGGLVDFWLQESLRKICRVTNLYRETLAIVAITNNTDTFTVTPSNGYNLKRVERVRAALNLFAKAASQGGWNASTNTPTINSGSASASNAGFFYIVTTAGTTNVDGTATWNVGDVIQSSGAAWVRFPQEGFQTLPEVNVPYMNYASKTPQSFPGGLRQWGQTIQNPTGTVIWYPPSLYDTVAEFQISEIPTGELLDIGTLPVEVEDAIVEGTLAQILRLPSNKPGMQNLELAETYRISFERSMANLKTVSLLGFGGSTRVVPPNFTGSYPFKVYWSLR